MNDYALLIAGSDTHGLAGIKVDEKVLTFFNVKIKKIITAVTQDDYKKIYNVQYTKPQDFSNQLSVLKNNLPKVIKIGMLGDDSLIDLLINFLKSKPCFTILDPILISSSGTPLFQGDLKNYIYKLKQLFPYIDLLTPNCHEASLLLNKKIQNNDDIKKAAFALKSLGITNVLLKGGHLKGNYANDFWTDGLSHYWISSLRQKRGHYRGTGCHLSSSISAFYANGFNIQNAIVLSKMCISHAIYEAKTIAKSYYALAFNNTMCHSKNFPTLGLMPTLKKITPFKSVSIRGLYVIVENVQWLSILIPLGIKFFQLRIKNKDKHFIAKEIKEAILLCKHHRCILFINDYWELALKWNAQGIHLGQEDCEMADLKAIKKQGLLLGISTHDYKELAIAKNISPSYIALGPIYPTTTKKMAFEPQGLNKLKEWRQLVDIPLVAIGGIQLNNINDVLETGVDAIAMISAITKSENPIIAAQHILTKVNQYALFRKRKRKIS